MTVRVLDRSSRPQVLLTGAVRTPLRFQLRRNPRLNELLIRTGGITDLASGEISIFRPVGTACVADGIDFVPRKEPATLSLKIADLLKGVESANPIIESGDIVEVVPAWPVYVIGGVNNPMQLSLRSELTVSRAVAAAGGIAKDGVSGTATIFRRRDGRSQVIDVDLSKIEGGSEEDIPLAAYDIVEVPQKGKEKRKFPPVIDDQSANRLSGDQLPMRVID
ncbi:MAG: SLBB domain-containing protein [Pyrinomonadaceae bacterium]|nr:SLBB domain-containing protein [Pyrinomonadaceae bacterium]